MKFSMEFMDSSIFKPIKNNLTLIMFLGGAFLIIISTFINNDWGDGISKVGSAILGAGVFAGIMKSSQFTEVFKKHIFDVLYDPNEATRGDETIDTMVKWRILTEAILKDTLPLAFQDATEKIEKKFLNDELSYHYEDYTVQYDIDIDENMIATIQNKTITTLVLSENHAEPVFEQDVKVISKATTMTLTSLYLNSQAYDLEKFNYTQDAENDDRYNISIPLKDFKNSASNCIKLERTTSWTQDLKEDPWITGFIKRYIKGLTIKAKVSDNYKLVFDKFGLEKLPNNYHNNDTGYDRWQLATSSTLLLPGQGYVLSIVKK